MNQSYSYIQFFHHRIRNAIIVFAVLMQCALYASAEIKATVEVEKKILRVGEQTRMAISVVTSGERIQKEPSTPSLDGLNFVFVNSNRGSRFEFINGRSKTSYEYTFVYDIFAIKEGKFQVKDISISSESGSVKANSFEITVFPGSKPIPTRAPSLTAPKGTDNIKIYLLADSSKKEVFQGEELVLSYDAVYHQKWRSWFDSAIQRNRDYAIFHEERGALKNFLSEPVNLKYSTRPKPVRMAGNRDLFFQKSLIRYVLFPLTPGEYSLNPLSVEFRVLLNRMNTTPFKVQPDPLNIKVKPLPNEGKPDIFKGAVGAFTIKAQAEPLELSEGETVTLRISLNGFGNIKNAPKPILPDLSNFDQFDPTQNESIVVDESGMRGSIEYSHVLIPHDQNANQIDPIKFAYFDPTQKKYIVIQTQPIALTIHPSSSKDVANGRMAFNRRLITRVGEDFRFIATNPAAITNIVLSIHRSLRFWLIILLPVLLLALAIALKWQRNYLAARPNIAKSLKAPKLARKLLTDARKSLEQNDSQAVYVYLGKAITDFISNRWSLACVGMTSLELKDALLKKGIADNYIASITQMLDEFDGVRFSGALQDQQRINDDYAKTEELLSQLMKIKNTI